MTLRNIDTRFGLYWVNIDIDYILQKGSSDLISSPPFATEEENRPSLLTLRYVEPQMKYTLQSTSNSVFDILYSKFNL